VSFIDRDVLIIDDILDEGHTLGAIIDFCKHAGARKVHTAVLIDKDHDRKARPDLKADFVGLPASTVTSSATAWTTKATGATPTGFLPLKVCKTMTNASFLDQTLFAELAEKAAANPRGRQHHNFHQMEEACHRMAVGLQPATYIPPHRHLGKQG
jgi:hypothetical protein